MTRHPLILPQVEIDFADELAGRLTERERRANANFRRLMLVVGAAALLAAVLAGWLVTEIIKAAYPEPPRPAAVASLKGDRL